MSARALLAPNVADRLAKICGRFGSDHDGERAAAAALADQLVRAHGLTWGDVIALPATTTNADWQRMASWCHAHQQQFNAKELEFVRTMLIWRGEPSEKQRKWLIDLFVRAGGARS